jgi:Family of unknown function (DUF6221)
MTETWAHIEAPLIAQAERDAAIIRQRLAEDEAVARSTTQASSQWRNFDADGELRDWRNGGTVAWVAHPEDRAHIARHDPARVLDQCGSIADALTELERIPERSPDPDSRAWARAAINSLRRIWEPDE